MYKCSDFDTAIDKNVVLITSDYYFFLVTQTMHCIFIMRWQSTYKFNHIEPINFLFCPYWCYWWIINYPLTSSISTINFNCFGNNWFIGYVTLLHHKSPLPPPPPRCKYLYYIKCHTIKLNTLNKLYRIIRNKLLRSLSWFSLSRSLRGGTQRLCMRQHVNMNEQWGQRQIRRLSSLYADARYEVLIKGIYESRRDV